MQVNPWLVLALVGGLVGADQVRTADAVERATVEVRAKRSVMSAPATPTVGLGFVAGGGLFDAGGNTRVGEGYSHCGVVAVSVAVPPEVTAQCTSTFRLQDGELHLATLRRYKTIAAGFEDASVAVVGGTGAFANARGEGKVTRQGARQAAQEVEYAYVLDVVTD